MKQQNSTEFKENGNSESYNKIGDQAASWSNAWCAVWDTAPEMRKETKGGVTRRNPRNQLYG